MSERDPFSPEFDEGEENEEEAQPKEGGENQSFRQLRADRNRLEKAIKAQTPELEELRSFKAQVVAEQRNSEVGRIFQSAGLNPSHSKLFTALNPEGEVTVQAVAGFAKEYGLVGEDTSFEQVAQAERDATPPAKSEGFAPFTPENTAPAATISRADWLKLMETDTEEAQRLFQKGRVDLAEVHRLRIDNRT